MEGTFACPTCGKETPHNHTEKEIADYRQPAMMWKREVEEQPTHGRHKDSAQNLTDLHAEIERLNAIINTPNSDDFLKAVSIEAEHQRQRFGNRDGTGKTPADWFWLVGYLGGKALHAHAAGNVGKAEHHIITTAAACANWHRAMFGKTDMRPGIDGEGALSNKESA